MQVWYENLDDNEASISAEQVRYEVRESFWKKYESELNCLLINKCVNIIIPIDSTIHWQNINRQWKESLIKQVKNLYDDEIEKAKKTLSEKFIPYVIHKLYHPDGLMTKKIKERFNNNKLLNKRQKY